MEQIKEKIVHFCIVPRKTSEIHSITAYRGIDHTRNVLCKMVEENRLIQLPRKSRNVEYQYIVSSASTAKNK